MNILITGGASGLGEAITRRVARESCHVVYITYSNSEVKAKGLMAEYLNVTAIKCSFGDKDDVFALKESMKEMNLDVLINNAYTGSFLDVYFHKQEAEAYLKEFELNLIPTIEITQTAITLFRKKKQGKIITILTSALLNTPPLGSSIYVANKAYLQMLTKVWATENVKYNISSNSISPSFMKTQLTSALDERLIEQMELNHPLKKLLNPDEVAEVVDFFIRASIQVNGVDFPINSGMDLK